MPHVYTLKEVKEAFLLPFLFFGLPPFPQIDIIGEVVIVWRVRGKIIRSFLFNIVCNNCAQCSAHTYEQTNRSLIGFCLTGPISLCLDSFLCMYVNVYFLYDCILYECVVIVTW